MEVNMLEEIKNVLVEALNVDADEIVPEAKLSDDLDIDSLSAVELALELESTFDVTIEDEELAKLETVQDIIDIIEAKKA
jgi:acyl carrier protein